MLNKNAIELKTRPAIKSVYVEAWGGEVALRSLTVAERIDFSERLTAYGRSLPRDATGTVLLAQIDARASRAFDIELLAMTIIDDSGQPMFSPAELDAMAFDQGATLQGIAVEAYRLNGFRAGSNDPVEEAAKKSEASPSAT